LKNKKTENEKHTRVRTENKNSRSWKRYKVNEEN